MANKSVGLSNGPAEFPVPKNIMTGRLMMDRTKKNHAKAFVDIKNKVGPSPNCYAILVMCANGFSSSSLPFLHLHGSFGASDPSGSVKKKYLYGVCGS